MASPFTKHITECKSRSPRRNMHRSASGKVKSSEFVHPAVWVPCPASDGIVYESCPDEHEDDARKEATSLTDGTDKECDSQASEHSLIDGVHQVWDVFAANTGCCQNTL